MKAGWEVKALGSLLEVKNGYAFDSKKFTPDAGTPLIRIRDIKEGKGTAINYNGEYNEEFICKQGDFLIGMDGEFGCYEWKGDPSLLNQRVCRLENFDSGLMSRFLFYGINKYLKEIEAVTGYTTVKHLSSKTIKTIEFPLPPLEEQRRIVSILDEAFEGLDRARENAEANLKNARELFESVLHASFSEDVDWDIAALNKHVQFVDYRGRTPPKMPSGIRLITAKNVKRGFINREPEEFMDQDAYDDWMTRGYPEIGDVLFTTEAPLANVALLDTAEKVVIGQRLITMKPDKGIIDSSFLCYALLSPKMQETIIAQGTGATVLGIKAKLLKAIPLRFPKDIRHQRDIAASCLKAFQNKGRLEATYNAKLQDLSDLRQSLLQKAFAGELT